jgi:hypothetical protein
MNFIYPILLRLRLGLILRQGLMWYALLRPIPMNYKVWCYAADNSFGQPIEKNSLSLINSMVLFVWLMEKIEELLFDIQYKLVLSILQIHAQLSE